MSDNLYESSILHCNVNVGIVEEDTKQLSQSFVYQQSWLSNIGCRRETSCLVHCPVHLGPSLKIYVKRYCHDSQLSRDLILNTQQVLPCVYKEML